MIETAVSQGASAGRRQAAHSLQHRISNANCNLITRFTARVSTLAELHNVFVSLALIHQQSTIRSHELAYTVIRCNR
jgi:hypothetical protein